MPDPSRAFRCSERPRAHAAVAPGTRSWFSGWPASARATCVPHARASLS